MNSIIGYIANILNIKTDSELVVLDMMSELKTITDIPDYQKFIKKNFNHYDLQYMTGFQKFIRLTEMYKLKRFEMQNKDRLKNSANFAFKLSEKVKTVSSKVKGNPELNFNNFRINGEPYFTEFEISQLSKIGSLYKCVQLQRSVSGRDALLERLQEQAREVIFQKALQKPEKNVAELVTKVANSVRA